MTAARDWLADLWSQVAAMPTARRFVVVGATAAFLAGALVGLVIGLFAYPPTAWFALLEVGVPTGILGAVIGALVGVVTSAVQRINDH